MPNDFTMELINGGLQQRLEEFRADGLSDSEIVDKISELKIEDMLIKVSDIMASDTVGLMENSMYEKVLEERTKAAQFIVHNEQIWGKGVVASEAMYCEAANTDDDYHEWAKAAPFFANKKHVPFVDIKKKCTTEADVWRGQYKRSNKVVHASPQETFGRLSDGPGIERLIPVGASDYGLAMPVVNSAISLSIVSRCFFNLIPFRDGLVFIQIIQKWTEVIRKYYSDIEASCFETSNVTTEEGLCISDRHNKEIKGDR